MKKKFEIKKIKKNILCKPDPGSLIIQIKTVDIAESHQFKKLINKTHQASKIKIFPSKFVVSNLEYYSFLKKNLLDSKQQIIAKNKIINAQIRKSHIKFFKLVLNLELKGIRRKYSNFSNSKFDSQFLKNVDLMIKLDEFDLIEFAQNPNLKVFIEFEMLNRDVCFFRMMKKVFFFKNLTHFLSIEINNRKKEFDQMKKLLARKRVCKIPSLTLNILKRFDIMLNSS